MKNKKLSLFILALLFLLPGTLLCQSNRNKDYEPELGQEGKDVIWYPTPQLLVDKMLDMAKLTPNDLLIDLGSGDGRIVITAAKRGTHAIGIEYNPDMVEFSKKNAEKEGVTRLTDFVKADLYEYDLSKASVITMFLLPEINRKLRPKLLELNPGTRIITNTFSMQDWPYDEMQELDDESITWNTAYLWIVPAKVEGTWKWNNGELSLNQEFQSFTGKLTTGNKSVEISNGHIRGNEVSFEANGAAYKAKVNNNKLKGTSEKNGNVSVWEAEKQE